MGNCDEAPLGKLPGASAIVGDLGGVVEGQGYLGPADHDPSRTGGWRAPGAASRSFRSLLIAQAMLDDLVLVSNEQAIGAYGVRRLW